MSRNGLPFFCVTITYLSIFDRMLFLTLSDNFLGYYMDINNYLIKEINKFVSIKVKHCIDFQLPFTLECIISSVVYI